MIDLPRDLAPWRASLDLFAPDVAEGLGPLLPRLALAIGPMRISRPTGDGEPDGFTGIARRGSYERLLLTEWLLADEAPLEFARRAATGEHAFFHLARRAPAHAMSSVAILDAGPQGLGAPRIAHLATLIVLAARAEKAGARFAWGLLHTPDRALFPAVTKESIESLISGRTAIGASADDDAAWIDRAAKSAWEDAWIVGARSVVPGWNHGTVEVRDLYDSSRRTLAIGTRSRGAAVREAELDLPPDRVAARILTDPFAPATKPAPTPAPTTPKIAPPHAMPASNLVFAANGTKVFARSQTGEIISYPTTGGRVKRFRPRGGGVVAAVGWVSRGCVMLVIDEREIRIQHNARGDEPMLSRSYPLPTELAPSAPQIHGPLSPLAYVTDGGASVFFADGGGALFEIGRDRDSDVDLTREDRSGLAFVKRIAAEAAAFAPVHDRFEYVGRGLSSDAGATSGASGWHLVGAAPKAPPLPLGGNGTFEARIGSPHARTSSLVAVQQRDDLWTLYQRGKAVVDLGVPEGSRVIGPWLASPSEGTPPMLVVLEADQRTLSRVGRNGSRVIERTDTPIQDAVVSTSIDAVAYATLAGEMVIRSIAGHRPIARFEPKDVR